MRLAIVRGPALTVWELQSYEPLQEMGVEITGFTSKRPLYAPPAWMRVERLASPMDRLKDVREPFKRVAMKVANERGVTNRLNGLEDALAGHDVYHSVETYNPFTGQCMDASARHGKPLVVTVWENIPFFPVPRAWDRIRRRVNQEAAAFVAITERARMALRLEGVDDARIHVIPAGIDLARFHPAPRNEALRAHHGIPGNAVVLLFAARLTWAKGLLDLLHAVRWLDVSGRARPDAPVHVLVMGQGEQREAAEARVRDLGLEGRVHFTGSVPYERTHDVFQAADAFVLGSIPLERWQEQFGMVLVEAMGCGIPVITAASGSIPEVVGDAARQYQPADPMSLAEAIEHFLDPKVRADHARRGRARAEARFDQETVARQLHDVYRAVT